MDDKNNFIKLKFLGTAAATGVPSQFCECDFCSKVRKLKGKNLRQRSGIAIDHEYRIDLSPDAYTQSEVFDEPLTLVKHLLITHTHRDHFDPAQLYLRRAKFIDKAAQPLFIYGPRDLIPAIDALGINLTDANIKFKILKPYKTYDIGAMRVTPVETFHDSRRQCFNYLIEYKNKKIFIGFDGKYFLKPQKVKAILTGKKLDLAIFEYTMGEMDTKQAATHKCLADLYKDIDFFRKTDGIADKTHIYLTHFSHYTNKTHDELEQQFAPEHIAIAYDGLELRI